jgi:Protein of unknown function (DUF3072)
MRHNKSVRRSQEQSQGSHEPMTGAQASHLKTLAEEVREPSAFAENLSKHEASPRIDALAEKVRLSHLPPHTD